MDKEKQNTVQSRHATADISTINETKLKYLNCLVFVIVASVT